MKLALSSFVGLALALVVKTRPEMRVPLARWGSVGVILAGAYSFIERLFLQGGGV